MVEWLSRKYKSIKSRKSLKMMETIIEIRLNTNQDKRYLGLFYSD